VLAALAALLALLQTGLLDLTQFLIQQRQVHTQDVLLPTAVGMAATLIMLAAHKAVLVVLAVEGGGLAPPVLAVLELLVKETLAAQAAHLLAGVGVVQELLVLPTLMVAQGLLLLFQGLLLLMLAAAAAVAQVFLAV
jgi:hypothetical protein